jgi:hypothetical protein
MSTPPLWRRGDDGSALGPQRVIRIDDAVPAETTDGSVPVIGLTPLTSDECDYVVMTFRFPPGYVGVVHSHPYDTVYVVRRGTFLVDGEGTFEVGDLRWVKGGTTYGPERAGPEGCEVLLITKGTFPPSNGPAEPD